MHIRNVWKGRRVKLLSHGPKNACQIRVESRSKMEDRGAMWCGVEVKALLEVWLGELIQAQLLGEYSVNNVPDDF